MKILSLKQATNFLGLSTATVKYHLYVARDLRPDGRFGRSLYFTCDSLDKFQARKRPSGASFWARQLTGLSPVVNLAQDADMPAKSGS